MLGQLAPFGESLATCVALEWPLPRVSPHVPSQERRTQKRLLTDRALVIVATTAHGGVPLLQQTDEPNRAFLPRLPFRLLLSDKVLPHVHREHEFPGEAFLAVIAMVSFLACVNAHMLGQVAVESEGYTALAALVGFLSGVRSHMPLQMGNFSAAFRALV